ncbi:oligosaccharide flippase family protein [Microgenomates group bacterium]|nr:oligosaccharide flippase family protein [Microgenomates group bacterium]
MVKKVLTQSFRYSAVLVASKVFSIVFFAIAARLLSKDNFGMFSFFVTLSQLLTTLTDLGLRQWYLKRMANKPSKDLLSRALEMRLMIGLLTAGVLFLINGWWPKLPMLILWCLMISLVLEVFFTVADAHYLHEQRSTRVGWKVFWRNLLMIALWVPLVLLVNNEVTYYSSYVLYVIVTSAVVIFYFPWKLVNRFSMTHLWEMGKIGRASSIYGVSDALSMAYGKVDGLIVEKMLNVAAFGTFVGLFRVLDGLNLIPQALYHNLFRITAKKDLFSKQQLTQITLIMAMTGIVMGGLLFLGAPLVVWILLGESYIADGVGLLRVFAVIVGLFFINAPLNTVIQSSNYLKKYLPIFGVVIALNIVLTIMFIRVWGMMGAAYAMAISQTVLIAANWIVIRKAYKKSYFV